MNLKTKLESKEGKWIRVHFPDGTFLTGRLMHIGNDFVQMECYGKDEGSPKDPHSYTQHLIPLSLVKLVTIEASSFLDAERNRLDYITKNSFNLSEE